MTLQAFAANFVFASALGGGLAVLLALAAPALRRRYTARTLCTAWLLLALRMLLPFHLSLPSAPVQIALPAAQSAVTAQQPALPGAGQADNDITAGAGQDMAALAPAGEAAPANGQPGASIPTQPAQQGRLTRTGSVADRLAGLLTLRTLGLLWAAGAALAALYQLAVYFIWRRHVLALNRPAPTPVLQLWRQCRRKLGIAHEVAAYENEAVSSPMVMGLVHPMLIVPCDMKLDEQGTLMLLHECEHLRRRDLWSAALLQVLVCLHWPNPAAWLLRSQARQEMEFACDQAVVRCSGLQSRRTYGQALLYTAAARPLPGCSQFGSSKNAMKRRLGNLYHGGVRRGTALLVCGAVTILLCGSLVACGTPDSGSNAPVSGIGPSLSGSSQANGGQQGSSSAPASPAADFAASLGEQERQALMNLCVTLPMFEEPGSVDDSFLLPFLFYHYTGGLYPEAVPVEGNPEQLFVPKADAEAAIRDVLGLDYDISSLADTDGAAYYCYYDEQAGGIYLSVSDYGSISYRLADFIDHDGHVDALYEILAAPEEPRLGVRTLHLQPSTDGGYTVRGVTQEINWMEIAQMAPGGTDENPQYLYRFPSYIAEEVRQFAQDIQATVAARRWADLADSIQYPITVGGVRFSNAEQFTAYDIDSLLDEAFYTAVADTDCSGLNTLFSNWQGVMLGDGQIWFSEIQDSNGNSLGMKITAINAGHA